MNWIECHQRSENLAAEAELAIRHGERSRGIALYAQAAEAEVQGLLVLDPIKTRTLGISAVSAVSLWYKARNYERAEAVAHHWLATRQLPEFATEQLKILLQSIWSEAVRQRAGINFAPGQVIVAVKGGEVLTGGAPLNLIVEKVQVVQSLLYRTAELLRGLPHRKRGGPSQEIQESCRPWLFQTAPGSYQFAVAIQESAQPDLFKDEPQPKEIAQQLLGILRASIDDPEVALPELVPDKEYRSTFLKLTRNLAPTGKTFDQLEVRSADEVHPITLIPSVRKVVGAAIRKATPKPGQIIEQHEETLHGVLRAVHLDEDWLEVTVGNEPIRVTKVGAAVDDVIGPLVNHFVVVQTIKDNNGQYMFCDIEAED